MKTRTPSYSLLTALALAVAAPAVLAASTDTWVGNTSANWNTAANWSPAAVPGANDSLVFTNAGSAGALVTNDIPSTPVLNVITFLTNASVFSLYGNPLSMASGGSIVNGGLATQTINNDIALTGSGLTVTPSAANANCGITLGGVISGNANLTKTGGSGSTLTLNGVNTFSGALTFNAGTVVFTTPPSASGGNLGNPSGITFGGSSTTTLQTSSGAGAVTISSPTITANANSTALFKNGGSSANTFEIAAKITGAGHCKQNTPTTSGSIVRFSNDTSDYTGNFSMAAGTVEFTSVANGGSPSSLGAASTPYTNANSSSAATFRYVGSASTSTTRPLNWTGTTGGFTLDGSGSGGAAVQFLGSGNLKFGAGAATLTLRGSSTGLNTLAQVINDSGGVTTVTKSDAGTWVLSGANNYSGLTTVSAGMLQLGGSGTLGVGTGGLTVSGGTLDLGGSSQTVGAVTVSGASTIQNGTLTGAGYSATLSSGLANISANLAGAGALSLSGAGSLALFGANSYNGGTTIGSSGTVTVTNDAGLGGASGSVLFSASGTLAATNNAAAVNNPVTIGSSRTITVNSGIIANFATPDTNTLTIAAKITGAGSVTKKSSSFTLGTVWFSNDANDYSGDFTAGFGNTEFTSVAEQGTASALGKGATATGGQINIVNASSSGTLRYVGAGSSVTHRALAWTGTTGTYAVDGSGGGAVQFLATTPLRSGAGGNVEFRLRGSNTGANTFAQVINDQGGLTTLNKFDAGTWILTAANTYSSNTTVSAGMLLVNGSIGGNAVTNLAGTLGGSGTINSPVTVLAAGTLQPGAGTGDISTLTINNALSLGGNTAMVINRTNAQTASLLTGNATFTFSGMLTVTNTGGPLQAGDTFTLFSATNYLGSFVSSNLPPLTGSLVWDMTKLAQNGTMTVGELPVITTAPVSQVSECPGGGTFTAAAIGLPAPSYQWSVNGTAIADATTTTFTTNDVHGAGTVLAISVTASNIYGSVTSNATLTIQDTTRPVITLNGANPLTVECHGAFTDPGASAVDGCVGSVVVVPSGTVDPNTPASYTVTYTADDGNGNIASATRRVNVVDTTPPSILWSFTNLIVSADTNCQALMPDVTGTNYILATDACSSSLLISQSPTNNAVLALGTNQVVLAVADSSTNISYSTNWVIVADTTPPVITTCAPAQTVTAGYGGTATLANLTSLLEASDACSDAINIVQQPPAGTELPVGVNNVVFYVDDGNGNTNTCSTTVTVNAAQLVPPAILSEMILDDGTFQLSFSGPNGQSYKVLASTDVSVALASWPAITNGTFDAGPATFIDTSATNHPARFYRIVSP